MIHHLLHGMPKGLLLPGTMALVRQDRYEEGSQQEAPPEQSLPRAQVCHPPVTLAARVAQSPQVAIEDGGIQFLQLPHLYLEEARGHYHGPKELLPNHACSCKGPVTGDSVIPTIGTAFCKEVTSEGIMVTESPGQAIHSGQEDLAFLTETEETFGHHRWVDAPHQSMIQARSPGAEAPG
jgi:hypothetical protein